MDSLRFARGHCETLCISLHSLLYDAIGRNGIVKDLHKMERQLQKRLRLVQASEDEKTGLKDPETQYSSSKHFQNQ